MLPVPRMNLPSPIQMHPLILQLKRPQIVQLPTVQAHLMLAETQIHR